MDEQPQKPTSPAPQTPQGFDQPIPPADLGAGGTEPEPETPKVWVPPVQPKRRLWLIVAVVVVLLAAAGLTWLLLNKKDATKSAAPVATTSKKTIVYAVHWLEDQQINGITKDGKLQSKGLRQYLNEYESLHSNVKFTIQQIPYNEYANKLKVFSDSGAAPDIYQIYSPWGASYVRDGMLAQPPADVIKDVEDNYVSKAGSTIDGKIWGIPTEINNYALLYNKDLFKAAGIVDAAGNAKPPTTWQEVLADAKKLVKKDGKGAITQYGFAFLRDNDWQAVDPFLSLLFSNGGQYLASDLKKATFNSPEGIAALDAEIQLFKDGSTDAAGNFYDFKDGKVGMVISPPWTKANFAESYGTKFESVVGVAPLPYIKKAGTLQYSWFTGVMEDSARKQESWDFLKWFTSDVQKSGTTRYGDLLTNTIGAIPARTADFNSHKDVLGDFFTSVFVKQMPQSTAEPNVLQSDVIKKTLMNEIQSAWDGKKTSKDALDSAAQSINKLLEQDYK